MTKAPTLVLAAASALLLALGARADPAVIALARAYLGPESTLDSITSIHYVGSLERTDPDSAEKAAVHASLDMVFARPLRQRLVVQGPRTSLTTVLDGYDAWDWLQDNADPKRFKFTWLSTGEIRSLRASTWENLYYYTAPEGGSVEDMGPATIDGVDCERVDFSHGAGMVYERYFDRDTGRLVLTRRGPESFRESGEIRVDGVRFPRTIVSVTRRPSGSDLVSKASFDRITLNEALAPGLFAAPDALAGRRAPVPSGGP